jgi:acetyl esterase/lipase
MKKILILIIIQSIMCRLYAKDIVQQDTIRAKYLSEQKRIGGTFANSFYPNYVNVHKLSEKQFIARIDSAANPFYTLLNVYKSLLAPAYVTTEQFEIKMYFDKILAEYPNIHDIYTDNHATKYPVIDKKISGNLQFFNDAALLENSDLMRFIDSFLAYKINDELNRPIYNGLYNKRLNAMWNLLPRYFKNQRCLSYHQYHVLMEHLTHNGIKHTEELYTVFKKQCRDTSLTSKLEKVYRQSRNDLKDHRVMQYKKIGNYSLDIHIFGQGRGVENNKKPAIVFFHGGSWSEGQASWHFEACRKYAAKGWTACSVEYRIYGAQGTLPFAAVMDARSAIRWLREHGNELGIDTGRIVVTGNSAGGHLALATALADHWNEKTDHLKFSPVPNLILVNSGVYDLTDEKTAWIRKDLSNKKLAQQISPNNLVRKHLPPMLLIHSAADQNVPYASAQKFVSLMRAAGNKVEFKSLQDGGHFIFDHPKYTPAVFAWRKEFLHTLGYPDSDGE